MSSLRKRMYSVRNYQNRIEGVGTMGPRIQLECYWMTDQLHHHRIAGHYYSWIAENNRQSVLHINTIRVLFSFAIISVFCDGQTLWPVSCCCCYLKSFLPLQELSSSCYQHEDLSWEFTPFHADKTDLLLFDFICQRLILRICPTPWSSILQWKIVN